MKMTRFALCVLMLSLTACSMFGPVQTPDDHRYLINAMPASFKQVKHTPAILLVTQPDTAAVYNTTNMAYTVKPYQVSFYSQNQWAATPSQMVLPLLAQSLEKTGAFRAVVVSPYIGKTDYTINTQIIKMQQNYLNAKAGFFELVMQVEIVRSSTGTSIATRQFSIKEPIGQASPYNGVVAGNTAMAKILMQVCHFAMTALN
ncbi:MAG TPA: ABC-type transport auxiliary lipoprotein family protein [Gammaproteobacteria bacterium]|jgi:cholesterol transport system auxiliary component|nr:ABC-type transport auxiliary lipoprotein family protein [Gammaproteobacteria bacterium]